jgi:hypothetical protein
MPGQQALPLCRECGGYKKQYGRYGYRRIHGLLMQTGWDISLSMVERIWRREGLKVPRKQPKAVSALAQ